MKETVKGKNDKGSKASSDAKKKTKSKKSEQGKLTLISKTEFGKQCGLSPGNLSNYIARGQVIVIDNKIDISKIENIEFLDKRKNKIEKTTQDRSQDYQLKEIEIAKKKKETRLLGIKEAKALGLVIPTEIVKILFTQHSKSILTAFDNAIDRILTKISKVKKLTNIERSKFRGELKTELNLAVDKSIEQSKKSINKMVLEYTEVRGRGEQK